MNFDDRIALDHHESCKDVAQIESTSYLIPVKRGRVEVAVTQA